jgi:lipoprotein NlpI|tara:strand:- start:473 stop:667 length:195 start_codon:yes stop_codon:yes gene_type:complete
MLGEYFLKLDTNDKEEYVRALNEIYFYANSLRIENREIKDNLSKWQAKVHNLINNYNENRVHIS